MLFSKGYVQISLNSSNREGRMSKELEYEFNNFANLLHKDCMNLMECLKKQDKDNKPILYLGKHYEKVILPYEEYQKMCNRLESIDNANPSEALNVLKATEKYTGIDLTVVKQALLKAQEQEAKFLDNLQRWFLLLGESGANTKYKVRDEMEAVIDELKEVLE